MQPSSMKFQILRRVMELANQLQVKGDTLYEEMSSKQYYLLYYVDSFGATPPTLRELAEAMGTSHQNTRQLVSKLEDKGYLKVFPDALDRRKTRISLTEKYIALWEKYQQRQTQYTEALFEDLSKEELTALLTDLEKILRRVRL